jgi:hypothetical protein
VSEREYLYSYQKRTSDIVEWHDFAFVEQPVSSADAQAKLLDLARNCTDIDMQFRTVEKMIRTTTGDIVSALDMRPIEKDYRALVQVHRDGGDLIAAADDFLSRLRKENVEVKFAYIRRALAEDMLPIKRHRWMQQMVAEYRSLMLVDL